MRSPRTPEVASAPRNAARRSLAAWARLDGPCLDLRQHSGKLAHPVVSPALCSARLEAGIGLELTGAVPLGIKLKKNARLKAGATGRKKHV
jgi:hypothetical protein